MAFVTVPQQAFLTDVLKTLISGTAGATGVQVVPKHPDINEALKLPVVVLTRVSNETMVLARNSGFYGFRDGASESQLERLEGHRYSTSFQFDVLARSNTEMLEIVSKLQAWLVNPQSDTFIAEGYPLQWQEIPLLHFANATSAGTATDLRISYKFRELSGTQVEAFDTEILQYSLTMPIWCDFLKGRSVDKILVVGNLTSQ